MHRTLKKCIRKKYNNQSDITFLVWSVCGLIDATKLIFVKNTKLLRKKAKITLLSGSWLKTNVYDFFFSLYSDHDLIYLMIFMQVRKDTAIVTASCRTFLFIRWIIFLDTTILNWIFIIILSILYSNIS